MYRVKMLKIAPSILAADFGNLEADIKKAEEGKPELLHMDIMDGHYVPAISYGSELIKSVRRKTELPFDTHLMIYNLEKYIPGFVDAGSNHISFHVEATDNPAAVIKQIHDLGCSAGIGANAQVPVEKILPFLDKVEMALVMSVNAGFGGQKFMPEALDKVKVVKDYITKEGIAIDIEIDGGINMETIIPSVQAGANVIVAGSCVFRAPSIPESIASLKQAASSIPNK